MMEIEGYAQILRRIKSFIPSFSNEEERRYIHFARYVQESEGDDSNADVEGRMRVIQNKITKM